ncbi:sortase [Streptomyces goshikiensis]|uniref:sortase n=1 Tax=Streptomyces goshikiensis TaxID=1942 RepID=UPI0036A1B109
MEEGSTYALPDGKRALERLAYPNVPKAVKAKAEGYIAEAGKLAGPYKVNLHTPAGFKARGEDHDHPGRHRGLRAELSGVKINLDGTGAVEGAATVTTNDQGTATATITPAKAGDLQLKATAQALPGSTLRASPSDPQPHAPVHRRPQRRRMAIIGGPAAAAIAAAAAAVLVHGGDEPAAQDRAAKATSAPAKTAPSAAPDPLTGASASSLGRDPKVADKTSRSQTDASSALDAWSASNPQGSGSHAVGNGGAHGGGGTIGEVLRIPALGKAWAQPVYEGVADRQLRSGVGHFPGTEKPGQVGNYAVAGHRSGVASPAFRDIDAVRPGAAITVTTSTRITYTYRVVKVTTVAPTDVNVIAQVPGNPKATPTKASLTLVTCWPANGHSKRTVVTATLVGSTGGV